MTGIIYCALKINRIRAEEAAFFEAAIEKAKRGNEGAVGYNPRWEMAMEHLESSNPNDWRNAVMEADIMLEEMVGAMPNARGENLGEKLRSIERSDFTTIDKAWDAHKVRNQIAHEAGFNLSEREARRVMGLYRDVFNEFHFI